MAALTIAFAAAWTASYLDNRRMVASAEARAATAARELEAVGAVRPGEEARLVAALNTLRALPEGQRIWGLGLSQAAKLNAQAERAYRNALRDSLLAHVALSLEDALRAGANRELLDGYLALHEAGDAKRIETAALRA